MSDNTIFINIVLKGLLDYWWLWSSVFVIWLATEFASIIYERIRREKKYMEIESMKQGRIVLRQLKNLKPWEFEDYIASLYSRLGYNTERVGGRSDGGIDVIAERGGLKHYIQCKKFITSKVGVSSVRDFYGAISSRIPNANGIFITTNFFTTEAKKFCEYNMIEAIDGHALLKLIELAGPDKEKENIKKAGTTVAELCPMCGSQLIIKSGKYGQFMGCSNFPKCKFTKKNESTLEYVK